MNAKEIRLLNELLQNAEKIRLEKFDKYQDSWKTCQINHLIIKLDEHINEIHFYSRYDNFEGILNHLVDILNYTWFLYYRIKELERE